MAQDTYFVSVLPDLSKFFKKVDDGAKTAGDKAGQDFSQSMAKSVERHEKAVASAMKRMEKARDTQATQADKVRVAELKLKEVMEKQGATASQIASAEASLEKARRDLARADTEAERSSKSLAKQQKELKQAQQEANDAFATGEKALDSYGDKSDKLGGRLGGLAKKAAGIGLGFAGVAGAGAFFGSAITGGMELEKVMGTLQAVTGSSAETMQLVGDRAKALGQDTELAGTSAASATDAMLALAKGGMSVEEAMDAAKGSIQLAGAAQIDAGQAAELQIAAINSFGLAAGDAGHIADVLTNAANSAATDVTDLGEALKYSAPMAANLGVSLEDTNAALGMLANSGVKGSSAGTALKNALKNMANPTDKMTEALDELGVKAFDAQGQFVGFAEVSEQLKDAQGRMSEQAFTSAASVAFGAEGLAFASAAAAGGAQAYEDLRAAMDTQGSAADTALAANSGLNGALDRMNNALSAAGQSLYETFSPMITTAVDALAKAVSALPGYFEKLLGFAREHKDVMKVLGGVLGGVAAGYTALKAAQAGAFVVGKVKTMLTLMKALRAGTVMQTAAQMGLNTAMLANPMGLIVIAIGAVVGALAVFLTKTETGQRLWKSFTDGVSGVVGVFKGVGSAIKDVWNILTKGDFTSDGLKLFGIDEDSGIVDFLFKVRDTFLNVKDAIGNAWEWLRNSFSSGWEWIKTNVVEAWNNEINGWKLIFELVTGAIGAAWDKLKGWLDTGWQWLKGAVIDAWNAEVNGWKLIFELVTGAIGSSWDWLKDKLRAGYEWVKGNVFDAFGTALDVVKNAFGKAVDGITGLWDGVRAAAAKPIKFVIDSVFNNGIVAAWNKVAGWVGLDEVQPYTPSWLGGFAHGGVLPGYTPGRDPYTFIEPTTGMTIGLSGGEAVLRPEATRALGSDWVDGANAAARIGGVEGVRRFLGHFYSGGVIGSIVGVVNKHFPMMTITSDWRPGDPGNHGKGLAVDFSNGGDAGTPQMKQAAQFFYENYGRGLLELIHSPFAHNIKNGNDVGDGFAFYTTPTMLQHRNHVHVASPAPLGDPKTMVEQLAGAIGGFIESMRSRVAKAVGGILDPIGEKIPDFGGLIGGVPKAVFGKMKDAVVEFLGGKADDYSGGMGTPGDVESWRDMAMAAMRRNGFNADDPAQVNAMLKQIQSESGGNPGIAQQIVDINGTGESAGVGLLQIIPSTFAATRDPELPNDRRDPWANMNAALRYYRGKYGGDLTTMWGHGHGYARGGVIDLVKAGIAKLYDRGGWLLHGGVAVNDSGKPEPILTNSQWVDFRAMTTAVEEMTVAWKGGDYGYGALEEILNNSDLAHRVVTIADVLGTGGIADAIEEIRVAFEGGNYGYSRLADVLGDDEWARRIVNDAYAVSAENVQAAVTEVLAAWENGADGHEAIARILHDDERARWVVHRAAQLSMKNLQGAAGELVAAFREGATSVDALSEVLGDNGLAENVVQAVAAAGATNVGRWIGYTDPKEILSTVSELPGLGFLNGGRIGALVEGASGVADAYTGQRDAAAKLADAEKALAEARDTGEEEKVTAAEEALKTARDGVASAAAAAGHAEVALAIKAITIVWDLANEWVDAALRARTAATDAFAASMGQAAELARMAEQQFQAVAKLRLGVAMARIEQINAAHAVRVAQLDVLRAQLEGTKGVREAEDALAAERERVAKQARRDYEGLSGAYDRYRWAERQSMAERLGAIAQVTPEILALEHEVNAANLASKRKEWEAIKAQTEAVYEYRKAVLDSADTQRKLAEETRKLAGLESTAYGMDSKQAAVNARIAKLVADNARLEGERDKLGNKVKYGLGRLLDWDGDGRMFFGTVENAWTSQRKAYDDMIAKNKEVMAQIIGEYAPDMSAQQREALDDVISRAAALYRDGNEAAAKALIDASWIGDAGRAREELNFRNELFDIDAERAETASAIEKLRLDVEKAEKIAPIEDTISSLDAAEKSERYTADAYRASSEAVRSANAALAEFEARAARDFADSAVNGRTELVVQIPSDKSALSVEEVTNLLEKFNDVNDLHVRVEVLERDKRPGPGELLDTYRNGD